MMFFFLFLELSVLLVFVFLLCVGCWAAAGFGEKRGFF